MPPRSLLGLVSALSMGCAGDSPNPTKDDTGTPWLTDDLDGDGFAAGDECNDGDPLVFPGAEERCNGIDDNCDGTVDEGIFTDWFRDADGDGVGDSTKTAPACSVPSGYVEVGGDCDDTNPNISPDAPELCDIEGIDDDCDGLVNEDDPSLTDGRYWFTDNDGDGFGDPTLNVMSCTAIEGLVSHGTDCDDTNPAVNPNALEVCDPADIDEDCDGFADELDPEGPDGHELQYPDGDDDGFGVPAKGVYFCDGDPTGYAPNDADCDDTDGGIHPYNFEICDDGKDNDCDTKVDDCGPLPDLTLADANETHKASSYAAMGWSVSGGGDFDGDGRSDILVGAPYADSYVGGVYVFPADDSSDPADASAHFKGGATYGYLGQWVNSVGDLDGDGVTDMAMGHLDSYYAPLGDVFFGPVSGDYDEGDADIVFQGDYNNYFPNFVDGNLDFNDDGVPDMLAAARQADFSSSYSTEGALYLYAGPFDDAELVPGDANVTIRGPSNSAYLGWSAATLGDVTGDGIDDVGGGAVYDSTGASSSGSVTVQFGGSDLAGTIGTGSADAYFRNGVSSEQVGQTISGRFDLDGDGYGDVATGAFGHQVGSYTYVGGVYVMGGPIPAGSSDLSDKSLARIDGEGTYGYFGWSMATGDLNGDSYGDMLVGAPYANSYRGSVYLFMGPLSGVVSASNARVNIMGAAGSYDYYGYGGLAFVDDVDSDRQQEVVTGCYYCSAETSGYGGVFLFYGSHF